jgi:hypothetical protein
MVNQKYTVEGGKRQMNRGGGVVPALPPTPPGTGLNMIKLKYVKNLRKSEIPSGGLGPKLRKVNPEARIKTAGYFRTSENLTDCT